MLASLIFGACSSEDQQIRERLTDFAAQVVHRPEEAQAARNTRITAKLHDSFAEVVEVEGEDLASRRLERTELLQLLAVGISPPIAALDLTDLDVRLGEPPATTTVHGAIVTSSSQPGDLHGQASKFSVDLQKTGGQWRVVRLWLGQPRVELPEARP
ncbi:MAG: hypothetical protein RJA70_4080 [Pseudomonadota bacterium]